MSSDNDMRVKSLLTNREREVFELLVQDKTTKEIAAQLFVSEKTVRNHISNVMCTSERKSGQVFIEKAPIYVRGPFLSPGGGSPF